MIFKDIIVSGKVIFISQKIFSYIAGHNTLFNISSFDCFSSTGLPGKFKGLSAINNWETSWNTLT